MKTLKFPFEINWPLANSYHRSQLTPSQLGYVITDWLDVVRIALVSLTFILSEPFNYLPCWWTTEGLISRSSFTEDGGVTTAVVCVCLSTKSNICGGREFWLPCPRFLVLTKMERFFLESLIFFSVARCISDCKANLMRSNSMML